MPENQLLASQLNSAKGKYTDALGRCVWGAGSLKEETGGSFRVATNGNCPVREELQANYTTLLHPDVFTKSNTDRKHVMTSSAVRTVEFSYFYKITQDEVGRKLCQACI